MYLIAIGLADQHTHLAALKLGLQAAIEGVAAVSCWIAPRP